MFQPLMQYAESELEKFLRILGEKEYHRLFISAQETQDLMRLQASFMEKTGKIHSLFLETKRNAREKQLLQSYILSESTLLGRKSRIVEGYIEISPLAKEVYHVFETSAPENEDASRASYEDWLQASREIKFTKTTSLHYALRTMPKNGKKYDIFDVIAEKEIPATLHLLTFLNPERNPRFSPIFDPKNNLKPDLNLSLDYLPSIDHAPDLNHNLKSTEINSPAYKWFADLPSCPNPPAQTLPPKPSRPPLNPQPDS